MAEAEFLQRIEAVRRFNRFYTRQIGVLREGLHDSPYPLAQARIIYEMAHRGETTATELGRELGLDAGYLSRLLRGLKRSGVVNSRRSSHDGRQNILSLSDDGETAFAHLNASSRHDNAALLETLSGVDQNRLVGAMETIQSLLGAGPARSEPYILRGPEPGDMGWVAHRHGVLYAEEFGWDEHFEALVAGIVADFVAGFVPRRERCWLVEREGEVVGSVFVVQHSKTIAKLRLMLVEPKARGLGIGARLVEECIRFARRAGYRKLRLWTNSVLLAARRIYADAGFKLVHEEKHHSFGHDLVGETWELDLGELDLGKLDLRQ